MGESRGFTLIEMVMVILLVTITGVIALEHSPSESLTVGAQADQLAGDVRYAQSLSMARGQRYCIKYLSATSYELATSNCTVAVAHPTGDTVVTLGSGITMGGWTNLPNGYVIFDGKGQPYVDAANTALSADATITLSSGSDSRTISISPVTGRVKVQ